MSEGSLARPACAGLFFCLDLVSLSTAATVVPRVAGNRLTDLSADGGNPTSIICPQMSRPLLGTEGGTPRSRPLFVKCNADLQNFNKMLDKVFAYP